MEGSSYEGFLVEDQMYFGDNFHSGHDAFMFTFGCVSKETNLFYEQKADGILGMGMAHTMAISSQMPIYEAMFRSQVISKRMFNICLGKNGGYFQVGGYNRKNHTEPIKWFSMIDKEGSNYKFKLTGTSINRHPISGSNRWNVGFIDSGTTFTYIPTEMWDSLAYHFDYYCEQAKKNAPEEHRHKYCPGKRFYANVDGDTVMCFEYDSERFQNRTKEFFLGYPVIIIHAKTVDGHITQIQWFPSEYLYIEKDKKKYCLSADKNTNSNEILFGGTLMRQNDIIFDIDNKRIGMARSTCSQDPNMIHSINDYHEYGTGYGL